MVDLYIQLLMPKGPLRRTLRRCGRCTVLRPVAVTARDAQRTRTQTGTYLPPPPRPATHLKVRPPATKTTNPHQRPASSRVVHAETLYGAQALNLDARLEAVCVQAALLVSGRVEHLARVRVRVRVRVRGRVRVRVRVRVRIRVRDRVRFWP